MEITPFALNMANLYEGIRNLEQKMDQAPLPDQYLATYDQRRAYYDWLQEEDYTLMSGPM